MSTVLGPFKRTKFILNFMALKVKWLWLVLIRNFTIFCNFQRVFGQIKVDISTQEVSTQLIGQLHFYSYQLRYKLIGTL